MMVDPNASLKKAGSKELTVVRGEILDVIQETSEKKVLCRNNQGKCKSHATWWKFMYYTTNVVKACKAHVFENLCYTVIYMA